MKIQKPYLFYHTFSSDRFVSNFSSVVPLKIHYTNITLDLYPDSFKECIQTLTTWLIVTAYNILLCQNLFKKLKSPVNISLRNVDIFTYDTVKFIIMYQYKHTWHEEKINSIFQTWDIFIESVLVILEKDAANAYY